MEKPLVFTLNGRTLGVKGSIGEMDLADSYFDPFEVLNKAVFLKNLSEYVKASGVTSKKAVLLLGEDSVFSKTLPQKEVTKEVFEEFDKDLPIRADDVISLSRESGGTVTFYGTSKSFIDTLTETFARAGITLNYIIPLSGLPADVDFRKLKKFGHYSFLKTPEKLRVKRIVLPLIFATGLILAVLSYLI